MTASARSLSSTRYARAQPSTGRAELSLGKKFPRPDLNPRDFGQRFPDQWMKFLRAHYRNPTEVAAFYGVTEKAAEKWWQGIGGPRGAVIAMAATFNPEGFQDYLAAEFDE